MSAPNGDVQVLLLASGFMYHNRSSRNLGDVAQQTRTIQRLRAAIPGVRILALANSTKDRSVIPDVPLSHRVAAFLTGQRDKDGFARFLPRRLIMLMRAARLLQNARRISSGKPISGLNSNGRAALEELAGADALLMSGAGVFNDRYATSLGVVWGLVAHCCRLLGKPVVFSGQQIGPLESVLSRRLTAASLKAANYVGVRDPISLEVADELGVAADRLGLTGDDAWDFPCASDSALHAALGSRILPEQFIVAQVRLDRATGFQPSDADAVARLLDRTASLLGVPVVFVRMFYANHDDDRDSAVIVASRMRAQCHIVNEVLDASTTKALLRRALVAVGASYHFCVFSISSGTPTFGYYRSPYMIQKMRGLELMWPGMLVAAPLDDNQSFDTMEGFLEKATRLERGSGKTRLPSGFSVTADSALQSLIWSLQRLRPTDP